MRRIFINHSLGFDFTSIEMNVLSSLNCQIDLDPGSSLLISTVLIQRYSSFFAGHDWAAFILITGHRKRRYLWAYLRSRTWRRHRNKGRCEYFFTTSKSLLRAISTSLTSKAPLLLSENLLPLSHIHTSSCWPVKKAGTVTVESRYLELAGQMKICST